MRTDKLMINADAETVAGFKRALAFKVTAGLTLVFSFGVIALTAPDERYSDSSMTPSAVVQPAHESSRNEPGLYRGADIDDKLTRGVDMHG